MLTYRTCERLWDTVGFLRGGVVPGVVLWCVGVLLLFPVIVSSLHE